MFIEMHQRHVAHVRNKHCFLSELCSLNRNMLRSECISAWIQLDLAVMNNIAPAPYTAILPVSDTLDNDQFHPTPLATKWKDSCQEIAEP